MSALPTRAIGAAAVAALVPIAYGAYRVAGDVFSAEPLEGHGVRLGMTADSLRTSFDEAGTWMVTSAPAGDLAMVFTPAGESTLRAVTFEFHEGLLVAIRASMTSDDPWADGETLASTPALVVQRSPDGAEGMTLTALARGCPTHADEVARLLAAH